MNIVQRLMNRNVHIIDDPPVHGKFVNNRIMPKSKFSFFVANNFAPCRRYVTVQAGRKISPRVPMINSSPIITSSLALLN